MDTPEKHMDARMPVLDLKVWINNQGETPRVSHTFFKKPVASQYVILKRSAVASKVKRTTLFQEAMRRLQHISPDCPWEESAKHLSDFANAMRISGYSHTERLQTIQGAVAQHRKMLKQVQ